MFLCDFGLFQKPTQEKVLREPSLTSVEAQNKLLPFHSGLEVPELVED